jgi:hypothetical protein
LDRGEDQRPRQQQHKHHSPGAGADIKIEDNIGGMDESSSIEGGSLMEFDKMMQQHHRGGRGDDVFGGSSDGRSPPDIDRMIEQERMRMIADAAAGRPISDN